MKVTGVYANMKSSRPIALIGGYDLISKSFYAKIKKIKKNSIFINVNNNKKIKRNGVFNYEIFHLKKILQTINKYKIVDILFLGKIARPNFSNFKLDGEIDKYMPKLFNSFKKGDGNILLTVLEIFSSKGYNIISPKDISESFFFNKDELSSQISSKDKIDINKSIKLLNDLAKYDNAQAIVTINGYIIAIEAAEGTDSLLKRVSSIRKKLNQLENKAGLLTKIPKKNQSKLIDLPVIGLKTLRLIKKANLNGIVINPKFTIVHNKISFLRFARDYDLKIYSVLK